MRQLTPLYVFFLLITIISCRQAEEKKSVVAGGEERIRHAKGLSIRDCGSYSLVTITNPWPGATSNFKYVLKKAGAKIPDSLDFPVIDVPVKRIVVTSTTHIPSLEMLGMAHTLVGFPNLSYISSPEVRKRIKEGRIRELGSNQSLNTEVAIDLAPDLVVGFGIDNNNPALQQLEKSGLNVMLNGDWNEQTPLGKAEWIKFFGALFALDDKAETIFADIERDYRQTAALAGTATKRPMVLIGGMFETRWNVPRGDSWGALFIRDAAGHYPWEKTTGTGSLSLPLESVMEKAGNADVWIGPGQYSGLGEMLAANPHYAQFKAFKNRNVFMFKKGETGGILYYELAPNRPDLVLRDVLHMVHPELLPEHRPYFFEKLK